MKPYSIGVDIGGTTVKLGLFLNGSEILEKWEIPTDKSEGGKNIIPDIAASVRKVLEEKNIPMDQVKGAGMGVPGPVDANGFVEVCVNLGWKEIRPAEVFKSIPGFEDWTVAVGNDANVAALGEQKMGGAKGFSSAVMITLGTGVGGGIVIDGKMVAGSHGMGGELGHLTVNPAETARCNCGNHGCLEQYASATGVVRVAHGLLEKDARSSKLRDMGEFSAKDVFDLAKAGDEVALEAVDILGTYLGLALSYVTLTVDPEIFIIGGGVSKAGSILTDAIEKHYHRFVTLSEHHALVRTASLGNDAGICGAAGMVE
ncbi:MAG: ROK family glucokinase [Lachnospiraceae bacterium]|nr:ROK family glucokinase [Lachnospiraceae bacterium]